MQGSFFILRLVAYIQTGRFTNKPHDRQTQTVPLLLRTRTVKTAIQPGFIDRLVKAAIGYAYPGGAALDPYVPTGMIMPRGIAKQIINQQFGKLRVDSPIKRLQALMYADLLRNPELAELIDLRVKQSGKVNLFLL